MERLFLVGPEAEWFFEGYGLIKHRAGSHRYRRRVRYAEALENLGWADSQEAVVLFLGVACLSPWVRGSRPFPRGLTGLFVARNQFSQVMCHDGR
ncbi:MAG: hypothetical protein CM1200mP18_17250 [Gammaproteobacteria bacterium]|nr:MAG: hypothetical protein CM1200mP18_17250 [Gammaproteobacteria bacterium]